MADMLSRISVLETEMSSLTENYRDLKLSMGDLEKSHNRQCAAITEMKNTLKNLGKVFSFVATLGPTLGVVIAKWVM